MLNKFNLIIALMALVAISVACSFTTANISSFNFGKNDSANPPATTFDVSDKIFAVANVSNTSSKHKMRFKVTFDKVEGKAAGEQMATKDIDFEGARPVFLTLTLPVPGEYGVEATLLGEDGKEIDKKSGKFTVTGAAPSKAPATDADGDADAEDKDSDK